MNDLDACAMKPALEDISNCTNVLRDAAAKIQDAAAEVRIQNSEDRRIKELHAAIDGGKPLQGLFALACCSRIGQSFFTMSSELFHNPEVHHDRRGRIHSD